MVVTLKEDACDVVEAGQGRAIIGFTACFARLVGSKGSSDET